MATRIYAIQSWTDSNGAWKVTTGAGVEVDAVGIFSA